MRSFPVPVPAPAPTGQPGVTAIVLGSLLLALAGCAIPEHRFPDKVARQYCERLQECHRAQFEKTFENRRACVEEHAEAVDRIGAGLKALGCRYDEDEAKACLQHVRSSSCGELDAWGECSPWVCGS